MDASVEPTLDEAQADQAESLVLEGNVVEGGLETFTTTHKNNRDKAVKSRIANWILIRNSEPGVTNAEIAKRMGISPRTLASYISHAGKKGYLKFDDPLDRIEYDLVPKVVENIDYWLKKRDKQVTLETAKGTIFKVYQDSKGVSDAAQTVLALKIEQAPTDGATKIVSGVVVGKPRQIED